jgi:PAS domain S-box-containing protein
MTFPMKKSAIAFIAVTALFLVVQAYIIVTTQEKYLTEYSRLSAERETELIGVGVIEPLIRRDYAAAAEFVESWGKRQEHVAELWAIAPNGYVIAGFSRDVPPGAETFTVAHQVMHGGQVMLTIEYVGDFSSLAGNLRELSVRLAIFSGAFIVGLGLTLLQTLRAVAIEPLQREIALRRETEEELEAVRAGLEMTVRERTAALTRELDVRQKAEGALKRSEEKLSLHLRHTPLGVIEWDSEGHIVEWNFAAERIFGYPREKALGRPSAELIADRSPDGGVGRLWERLRETRRSAWCRSEGQTREGMGVISEWYATPIIGERGGVSGAVVLVLDITNRVLAEEQLKALNEELEERVARRTDQLEAAMKEIEAFSYSVSHDLRAPLRAIDGFSQALIEDCSDGLGEVGRGYIARVRAATLRMATLIDDILKLSRVSRAEMRIMMADMGGIAREVAEEIGRAQPDRAVRVEVRPDTEPTEADAALVRIVFDNLLRNAWKFTRTREEGYVEVGSFTEGRETVYYVKDNGVGFDMAYVGKLFGAFQRLHSDLEFEGTGIGLATVQRVVARHGGRVWAEGRPGEGATFYFTMRAAKGEVTA